MSSGTRMFLCFLAGAAAGAGGLALLNRNRMDFSHMKPMYTDLLARGINLKDNVVARLAAMKEDFDDMSAEARDRVDAMRMAEAAAHEGRSEKE